MAKRKIYEARHCPCCEAVAFACLEDDTITDRYGKRWALATCGCGVQFQLDPMNDDERESFYGSGEYRRLCEQVTGKPWTDRKFLEHEQWKYAENWIEKRWQVYGMGMEADSPPFARSGVWLDYGGSTGIASRRWSSDFKSRVSVVVADYGDGAEVTPEESLKRGPYDAILCCQTLDHLREPLVTLKKFREVAKDGARLFVDVVKKAHTEYKLDHDVYFPTAQSFVGLVERAGWSILWLDCETNPTHYSILAEKV